jgi:ribosome assembly protein 4
MSAFSSSSAAGGDAKRRKTGAPAPPPPPPSSVIVSFRDQEGEANGTPTIDLPTATTAKQLELLINSLLTNTETLPYAFYVNNVEVTASIAETLQQLAEASSSSGGDGGVSYEETIAVTYQPLSVFRVRPVTRCVETMPGHTDAVLHVSYRCDNQRRTPFFLPFTPPAARSVLQSGRLTPGFRGRR